jgi:formyltetrahydrofolate-dependent phosphoribosylglycinamide formyltransferase
MRLAVFLSGSGTTLQNLLDQIADGRLDAEIAVVLSSKPGVLGLERAQQANLPAFVIPSDGTTQSRSDYAFEKCRGHRVDLVVLAGFLKRVEIPSDFEGRVMNIHPSLIPAFCGKGFYGHHVHEAALERGVKVSGCTVHFSDNQYDHGPIILQRTVPVLDDDTPDSLAARVFEAECVAYPEAIRLFGEKRLKIEGRRVRILPNR